MAFYYSIDSDYFTQIYKGAALKENGGFLQYVFRCLPLLLSLWTIGDVTSDSIQASVYYKYSGSYRKEACKVSPSYFIISIVTFFMAPFMATVQFYWDSGVYGAFSSWNESLWRYRKIILQQPTGIRIFLMYIIVPAFTFCRVVIAYFILMPFCSFYFSVKHLIYGHTDLEQKINIYSFICTPTSMITMQAYEQLLQATPQIILSLTFLINNQDCHSFTRSYSILGIQMTTTIVSLVFSCISFMFGVSKLIGVVARLRYETKRRSKINFRIKSQITA